MTYLVATYRHHIFSYILISISCFLASCSDQETASYDIDIDLRDPRVQHIIELGVRYDSDSILTIVRQGNPTEQLLALRAIGSWKDRSALEELKSLVDHPSPEIRHEATHVLGLIGSSADVPSLVEIFAHLDTNALDKTQLALALEAVGRIADSSYLRHLSSISSYRPDDNTLLLGQAKGIYEYSLRGIQDHDAHECMIKFVSNQSYPLDVRKVGAQYLLKSKITSSALNATLADLITTEKDHGIRKNIISYLARTKSEVILAKLLNRYKSAECRRVEKLLILDALEHFSYSQMSQFIYAEMKNPDARIATEAADLCIHTANRAQGKFFLQESFKDSWPWYVKAKLQSAVNLHLRSPVTFRTINVDLIYKNINYATSQEEKIAYINALRTNPYSFPRVINLCEEESDLRTKQAYAQVILHYIKAKSVRIDQRILGFVQWLLESKDIGLSYWATEMIAADATIKNSISSTELQAYQATFDNPQGMEVYLAIEKLLGHSGVVKPSPPGLKKSLNWNLLQSMDAEGHIYVEVQTDKGTMALQLFPKEAPVTVLNFLELTKKGFFDNKTFPRVVTNFVVQTGCDREDGFGALDYSIVTETPHLMDYLSAGCVGMASGGRNTESTQWFITMAPTAHLDGEYTLFGRVIPEDLHILESIDQGDKIISAKIIDNGTSEDNSPEPNS